MYILGAYAGFSRGGGRTFQLATFIINIQKLGGFYVRFAISENAGISQEKGPFVHQPTF